jgi:hypothetical protein
MDTVTRVLERLAVQSHPVGRYVVKIDNWFDHKSLNFSGKGRVGLYYGALPEPDIALDEFWQNKITFPPFNPRRVKGEWYFARKTHSKYLPSLDTSLVHRRRLESSANNLHMRITDFSKSAVFVWCSSNTKVNRRGSIMVYEATGSDVSSWYAGFCLKDEWQLSQTKGISREAVLPLMLHDESVKP